MKQTLTEVESNELENVRKASDILMEHIVTPLRSEIKSLRKDVDKFRKAVEKIPTCPMADSCPVSRELLVAEAGDTQRSGKNAK